MQVISIAKEAQSAGLDDALDEDSIHIMITHNSDFTSKVQEFSNPVDMAKGLDSTTTLLPVITFATSCKSSGGAQLEEGGSSFKAMSVSNVSAIVNEARKESLDYCGALY